jgi:hypothetical protein
MEKMLGEEYEATPKEVSSGHHAANDDMQEAGWNDQRAVNKYLEKYPEDNQGDKIKISTKDLWK